MRIVKSVLIYVFLLILFVAGIILWPVALIATVALAAGLAFNVRNMRVLLGSRFWRALPAMRQGGVFAAVVVLLGWGLVTAVLGYSAYTWSAGQTAEKNVQATAAALRAHRTEVALIATRTGQAHTHETATAKAIPTSTSTPKPRDTSTPRPAPTATSRSRPKPRPVVPRVAPRPTATSPVVAWLVNMKQTIDALAPFNGQIESAVKAAEGGDWTTGLSFIEQAQTTLAQAQAIWNGGPPPPVGDGLAGTMNADVDGALKHYANALALYHTGFANQDADSLYQGLADYNQGTADITAANKALTGK